MRRLIIPTSVLLERSGSAQHVQRFSSSAPPAPSHHPRPLRGVDLNRVSFVDEVTNAPETWQNPVEHPVWDLADAETVKVNHKQSTDIADKIAYFAVRTLRWSFDTFSGFRFGNISEKKVIRRCIFLETVAGVPGMVAGMLRHMHSLRSMERDHGWIHTLLEEAENERMHLLTFMELRQPGLIFRISVLIAQGIFFNLFFLSYLVFPRICHRFVGYLEEEAVITYTHILTAIDLGQLPEFAAKPCPEVAKSYWHLPQNATFRDMILAIRADEAGHRLVNHTFADMHAKKMERRTNPFIAFSAKRQ